jgi:hypothetical protein
VFFHISETPSLPSLFFAASDALLWISPEGIKQLSALLHDMAGDSLGSDCISLVCSASLLLSFPDLMCFPPLVQIMEYVAIELCVGQLPSLC